MKKFVCSVCGYVHEGDAPPEKCPTCGVGADKFNEVVEGAEWYGQMYILSALPKVLTKKYWTVSELTSQENALKWVCILQ